MNGRSSGTPGTEPNSPVQRNQKDNDVISGRVRNWRPGAQRLIKTSTIFFNFCYALKAFSLLRFLFSFSKQMQLESRKDSFHLQCVYNITVAKNILNCCFGPVFLKVSTLFGDLRPSFMVIFGFIVGVVYLGHI